MRRRNRIDSHLLEIVQFKSLTLNVSVDEEERGCLSGV